MAIDPRQMSQLMNMLPFPISSSRLVQIAIQMEANDTIITMFKQFPEQTFNSPEDLLNLLPFPTDKNQLAQLAQQYGVHNLFSRVIQQLPDQPIESSHDLLNQMRSMSGFEV